MRLVEAAPGREEALRDAAVDFVAAGEAGGGPVSFELALSDTVAYLEAIQTARDRPAEELVPMTTYWLVDDERIVGVARLRHRLSESLLVEGGHIGYEIRPSARRRGFGCAILTLMLERARAMGMDRVLVTCNEDNLASRRIIERHGGRIDEPSVSPRSGKTVLRFWIDL